MTNEELMAWAHTEHAQRIIDLQDRTASGLKNAQSAAESRRKAVGLTRGQAAIVVSEAGKQRRRSAK